MALDFPNTPPPTEGQLYVGANGITYVFSGGKWVGQGASGSNVTTTTDSLFNANFVVNLDATGNLNIPAGGDVVRSGLSVFDAVETLQANSTGADVAAANVQIGLLWTNAAVQATSINTINANVAAANLAVTALSANVGNLVNNAPAALDTLYEIANSLGNNASLSTTLMTAISGVRANVNAANLEIASTNANLAAFSTYANLTFTGGGGSTYSNVNVEAYLGANIGAYQTFANSNAATQATSINTINANIGSFYAYANLNYGTSSYANANVASYLPTYTGNIAVGNIVTAVDTDLTVATSQTLTTNNSYTNTTDFSTDVDLGGGNIIAGWYQRNSEQIEFALFGPSAFQTYLTGLALGRTVIVTYSTGSGNQTLTRTLTQAFTATGQTDPANPTWGRVSGRIDATLPAGQTGIVSINFPVYSISRKTWTFDADGTTTLPTVLAGDTSIGTAFNTNPPGHTLTLKHNGGTGGGSGNEIKFDYGNVNIKVVKDAGTTQTWQFNSDGNLTLPQGGTITEGGGITGAIRLTPAGGGNTNQALLIYPTAGGDGDHVHLTAGGGSTELYLGNDSRYVKLASGGNVVVRANDGAVNRVYNWVGQGGWNQGSYANVATTGGTGTGLTVDVAAGGAGYINITAITINTAGTGYSNGDVITINNENNLPGTFQIGIALGNWTFGTDGALASEEFKIKTLDGIPTSITGTSQDTQLWDYNYGSNLATTGGTGSGLTVNVSDAGSGYASIAINVAGTGYSPGDIITVTNGPFNGAPIASSVTFTIGVSGTRSWTFDRYGALTLPSGTSNIQSVQQNNYQSKVTVSPFQILSQARRNQSQSFETAEGDFTSASSDGNGMITFVGLQSGVAEFLIDTMENGGVYERTVRLNGAGPEYGYSSFNDTDDELFLIIAAPAGAVTEIRFSYTRISKIDICPDEGVFRIESEPSQDIDIQAGDELRLTATERVDIDTGTNMRLRAGDGSVQISTNYLVPGATEYTWEFTNSGRLILPNNTILKDTAGKAIAFGYDAGLNSQSATAIAIGTSAGYQSQGNAAVAVGESAGEMSQGANAVAIGYFAGGAEQGVNSIAIGYAAGYNGQAANSIILNATGSVLNRATANTFTVAPVRNDVSTANVAQVMFYNTTSKEITYGNTISIAGNLTVGGNITQQSAYYETYSNVTNSGGNLTCNFVNGSTFYATLTANVTVNFTNVVATAGRVTGATLIVDQGATAYRVANIQINSGGVQTIKYAGGTPNTGTASNTDIMSFSLISLDGTNWRILGQISNYG